MYILILVASGNNKEKHLKPSKNKSFSNIKKVSDNILTMFLKYVV